TLHRISALKNRRGDVVGLTCRVGRAVFGTVEILRDVIEKGESILLLGRPGVGKTTLLREAARVLAEDAGRRVVVVDTSNEIAGDGDIPHPGIGRARRMQVPVPDRQHQVMIEAVENHMPEVIVIDEIGTEAEAAAAHTIAERGVQLIATAHGNSLENLLHNPTLSDLVGGIQAVTLSDEEARRRGTQKTVLERKAPPTFDVVVEIRAKDELVVHHDIRDVVDRILRGGPVGGERRRRTEEGYQVEDTRLPVGSPASGREGRVPTESRRGLRLFPYAVSRDKLEKAIRSLKVPVRIVEDLAEADVVLTVKAQERRQPRRLREARLQGVRLEVIKRNSVPQIADFLREELGIKDALEEERMALMEVREAIAEVGEGGRPVTLSPRQAEIRKLQHEEVGRAGLESESRGRPPFRRLVVFPR
ncbi:MAG: AAA family ATPase, partial [Thermoanaerobaculia bacterium]|nr:AAA family ATPase [Thermoanaerobaculia bacterium]